MRVPGSAALLAAFVLLLAGCTTPTGPAGPEDRGGTGGTDLPGGNGGGNSTGGDGTGGMGAPPPGGPGKPPEGNATAGPVVVTLTLDKQRIAVGEVVTATAVAENRGSAPHTYQHGGCPFSQFLIRIEGAPEQQAPIDWWNYTEEPRGCAAMIYTATLQPGERVVQQAQWNGRTGFNHEGPHDGPPVAEGTYTVTATWLATEQDRARADAPIEVTGA